MHIPHLYISVSNTTLCPPAAWRGVLGLSDADRLSRVLPWALLEGHPRRASAGGAVDPSWVAAKVGLPYPNLYHITVLSASLTGCVPRINQNIILNKYSKIRVVYQTN